MEQKLQEQLDELEVKVSAIHEATKKTERYMKWTFWVTIIVVVLPLLAVLLLVPMIVSEMSNSLGALEGLY